MFLPCELITTKYLVTSGENVRASRYLIVTLSLGQSTSPFAPTNNEIRKNRGRIKLHRPTFHTSFLFYRHCHFSLQLSHQFGLQQGEQYSSIHTYCYAFLICLLCSNGLKCSEEKCMQCMDGFEGDIIRFPCVQKCQRCNYCRGFLGYLGVCKKHCQNGVQGCITKCKNGKVICSACQCTQLSISTSLK